MNSMKAMRYAKALLAMKVRREGLKTYCYARQQRLRERADIRRDIERAIDECRRGA